MGFGGLYLCFGGDSPSEGSTQALGSCAEPLQTPEASSSSIPSSVALTSLQHSEVRLGGEAVAPLVQHHIEMFYVNNESHVTVIYISHVSPPPKW